MKNIFKEQLFLSYILKFSDTKLFENLIFEQKKKKTKQNPKSILKDE